MYWQNAKYLLSLNRTDRGAVEMSIIFRVTPHNSVPAPMINEKGKTAEAEYREHSCWLLV